MNNVTFAGRAGGPAVVRKIKGGDSVANFSLAVDRFKKEDGPLWVKVTLWAKQADALAQYITKGKQLVVSGSADLQSYETKDGETRTDLVVRAISVTLMGGGEAAAEDAQETEQNEEQEVADEDIPF
jgi:single-strand DNA-binding protein